MSEQINLWRHKAAAWTKDYGYNPYLDGSDADSSINRDLNEQKLIAEELYANHPIAKSIINNACNHTVLSGLTISADTDSDKQNDKIEKLLKQWSKKRLCDATRKQDLNGIFELIVKSLYIYGESFGILVNAESGAAYRGLPHQVIKTPTGTDNTLIKNGVEVDKYGTPVRIHIEQADGKFVKKPYYDSEGNPIVLHSMQQSFFNQTHGQIPLTAAYNMLLDLSVFIRSEVNAAAISSQINIVTKQNNPELRAGSLPNWSDKQNQDATKTVRTPIITVQPGKFLNLSPGESIEQFKLDRPSNFFVPFVEHITKVICSSFGMSYEYLACSWADSNYSSARINAIQTQAIIRKIQRLVIETSIKPLVDAQIRHLVETGELSGNAEEICEAVTVNPPSMPLLDPVKEATAAKARLDAGLSTLQKECEAIGTGDYSAVMVQQAREKAEREALGLLPTDNQPAPEVGRPAGEGSTRG